MRLLFRGCALPNGIFPIHSRFTNVINFQGPNEQLLALVKEAVGAGPSRLVVDEFTTELIANPNSPAGLPIPALLCICRETDRISLTLNDRRIFESSYAAIPLWMASCRKFSVAAIEERLPLLKEILLSQAHPRSLGFLFDPERERTFSSNFDRVLVAQLKGAFATLHTGNLTAALQAFKGKGYGLTPSGDDFNLGLLTSLHLQGLLKSDYFIHVMGKNHFVNHFFLELKQALFSQTADAWFESFAQTELQFHAATMRMLSQGETSGADWMCGFVAAFSLPVKNMSRHFTPFSADHLPLS